MHLQKLKSKKMNNNLPFDFMDDKVTNCILINREFAAEFYLFGMHSRNDD
jgi:hypothetical protein